MLRHYLGAHPPEAFLPPPHRHRSFISIHLTFDCDFEFNILPARYFESRTSFYVQLNIMTTRHIKQANGGKENGKRPISLFDHQLFFENRYSLCQVSIY